MASPGATRAIVSLGWPMFVGQLAVVANGVIDNVMAGHLSARDLASVAIGSSVYYMVFVGLMGTMQAISPVAAQHHGAGRWHAVGETWRQGQWLAAALLLPGLLALAFPGALLSLAGAEPVYVEQSAGNGFALAWDAVAHVVPHAGHCPMLGDSAGFVARHVERWLFDT